MLKKTCVLLILTLSITCSAVLFVNADTSHNYTEIYIHNDKIEARLKDWTNRSKEHAVELEKSDHPKIQEWRHQMASIDLSDELMELKKLNTLINNDVRYVDDYTHFHKKDFWATPITAIEEGGDCEDIALLKAASLSRLKWPPGRMHLLVGFLTERGRSESHAVLMVEIENGDQLILRSITNQVVSPDRFGFTPVYAVDGHGTIIVKPKKP